MQRQKYLKETGLIRKDKWGKKVKAYVIDEADRERYVERSVKVNNALLKKTWAEKAMTGAKLKSHQSIAWDKRLLHKG